ncbi:MAG TPA: molybdopterin-binding protein [Candidatus Methylacidiphilales bacterium]|jgi:molybdopterin adenylyltransferase|nr:molybdopterin-binding protein [Candidatus Methylacidiphilales bacterium]
MKIGRVTLIDPATAAKQKGFDLELEKAVAKVFLEPSEFVVRHVANTPKAIKSALLELCDEEKCPLVLTFGGVGPAPSDIIPDVTLEIVDRKLPGFGDTMRWISYDRAKVSILSRAEGGIRGKSLVINMPSRPKPVKFCFKILQEPIAEALEVLSGSKPGLRGDEIELPIDRYLPFLKKLRPKPEPGGPKHPIIGE